MIDKQIDNRQIDRQMIDIKKFVYILLEVEKAHNLSFVSRIPRKPIVKFTHFLMPCLSGILWCNSQFQSLERQEVSQLRQTGNIIKESNSSSFFLFAFCSIQVSSELDEPTHIEEINLFYWVHKFKCSYHLEIFSHTHPKIIFNLDTPWQVKMTHKINHHNVHAQFSQANIQPL